MGYRLSNKENNPEGKKYYAWIIYKLQRELEISTIPFREVNLLSLDFYVNNPELFKQQELEGEKVLKVMMERGYTVDKSILYMSSYRHLNKINY
jgi:hypothetical protein